MPLRITLGNLLHECAHKFGEKPLVTIAENDETISYINFERLVNRFAHGLFPGFANPGDYFLIMLENNIEYLAVSYALKKIDVVEVSINRAFRAAALARMINLTNGSVLLTSDTHLDALDAIRDDIATIQTLIIVGDKTRAERLFPNLNVVSFDSVLSEREGHIASEAKDTKTATILFTSGTTGVSKGCLLSHRYAVRTAENVIPPFRVTAEDCVYSPYPLSHIGPAYYDVLPTLMTGGRVILRERFSLSAFWPEVAKFGVTWFLMLGSVQQLLWSAKPNELEKNHSVTRCWGTPAPVPKADFDRRFNLHLIPGGGYGSTDAGWVVAPQWDHPGGIVLPQFEVAIVDENDDPLPAGQAGELVIRSKEPGVMSDGYFGMAEKSLASRRNLWFHTGDIAKLDDEGRFYFLHRMSERIRVKGEMVSAFEVEEGALTHDKIEDCAAIGIPGESVEEDIKLFVVCKPGTTLSAEEIRQHCAKRMAKFMVPSQVKFLQELPRTPTGKVEKSKLAALI